MPSNIAKTAGDYQELYRRSIENPELFWEEFAHKEFVWHREWQNTLKWNFHEAKVSWFEGARLNITENCLDRHVKLHGEDTAIIWEANDPDESPRYFSYKQLYHEVCRFANVLKKLGVQKGDRVCIYLPMVPELAISTLACARIGAVHSVVFAGFSSGSLTDRINDAGCKVVLTSDGAYRGDKQIALKEIVDEALISCPGVEHCLVLKRTGTEITWNSIDQWWHEILETVSDVCEAVSMDAEDPLFILYTSGSTGKPKGMVHTTGGYMVYANFTFRNVFQYQKGDIYWCTADIGWITGHSYILYGPLSAGACTLMFEGIPTWPDQGRFWEIIDKYRVNIFYTAPTAIRSLMQFDPSFVQKHSLNSLKTLGTVGEPINEEAWHWYHTEIGKGKCEIVDTWWQTETGGIMISNLAGVTPAIPTYAANPLPGVQPVVFDESGHLISESPAEGRLAIAYPWPGMARTIWGNHQRFKETYFSTFPGYYFPGDGCKRDSNGNYRITGRVDDIVIVSGHNLGTAEIENAIDEHPDVAESAVVGFPHDIKGQAVMAFVICYPSEKDEHTLQKEIIETVSEIIGPIAKPERVVIVPGLPKTRSGKIMRRILRKLAAGDTDNLGDTSTLLDPGVVDQIRIKTLATL